MTWVVQGKDGKNNFSKLGTGFSSHSLCKKKKRKKMFMTFKRKNTSPKEM
jgi:hypothetical protein